MRFAWLKEKSADYQPLPQTLSNRVICTVYNLVWWLPLVLPIFKVMDYRAGILSFLVITLLRALANAYRNNILDPVQAHNYPFRSP